MQFFNKSFFLNLYSALFQCFSPTRGARSDPRATDTAKTTGSLTSGLHFLHWALGHRIPSFWREWERIINKFLSTGKTSYLFSKRNSSSRALMDDICHTWQHLQFGRQWWMDPCNMSRRHKDEPTTWSCYLQTFKIYSGLLLVWKWKGSSNEVIFSFWSFTWPWKYFLFWRLK